MKKLHIAMGFSCLLLLGQASAADDADKLQLLSNLAGQWSPLSQCALFPKKELSGLRENHEFIFHGMNGLLAEEVIRAKRNFRDEIEPVDVGVMSVERFDITQVNGKEYYVLKQLVRIPRANGEVFPLASISYLDYQEHYIQRLFQEIDGQLVIQYGRLIDHKGNVGQKDPQRLYRCDHPKTQEAIREWELERNKEAEERRQRQLAEFRKHAGQVRPKGESVAAASKFKYTLKELQDPLTKHTRLVAENETMLGSSSVITELSCVSEEGQSVIRAELSFHDLKLPAQPTGSELVPFSKTRKNDQLLEKGVVLNQSQVFDNVYTANIGLAKEGNLVWMPERKSASAAKQITGADVVYDLALQIKTSAGDIYLEIPPYNTSIQKVISTCSP